MSPHARLDGRWLAAGIGLGIGLTTLASACSLVNECRNNEPELYAFEDGDRAYRYGFDVNRASFHDDATAEGQLVVDRAAEQVVIRYETAGGEKVETWALGPIEREAF